MFVFRQQRWTWQMLWSHKSPYFTCNINKLGTLNPGQWTAHGILIYWLGNKYRSSDCTPFCSYSKGHCQRVQDFYLNKTNLPERADITVTCCIFAHHFMKNGWYILAYTCHFLTLKYLNTRVNIYIRAEYTAIVRMQISLMDPLTYQVLTED
jgi:hypothetical protein